jgi:ribosomal-protein-alanine N-acetyltransferase
MEKLGMTHDEAADFDHPAVPEGHPLRRCVLYRISRQTFTAAHPS